MKTCNRCKTEKVETEFYRRLNKKTGEYVISNPCKSCAVARASERQRARLPEIRQRREKRRQYFRDYKLERKKPLRDWVKKYKSETPCMDCKGVFPPECMDFDHRDPTLKVRGIAAMIGAAQSFEAIQAEVAKCDLVCACCHRIRTARQQNRRPRS